MTALEFMVFGLIEAASTPPSLRSFTFFCYSFSSVVFLPCSNQLLVKNLYLFRSESLPALLSNLSATRNDLDRAALVNPSCCSKISKKYL